MKSIIQTIMLLLIFSCSPKNEIRITILNNQLNLTNFDNELTFKKNHIKIKIENLSTNNYVISNFCFPNKFKYCSMSSSAFPAFNGTLDLDNLLFINDSNDTIFKPTGYFIHPTDKFVLNEILNDSIIKSKYKNIGYKSDDFIFFNKNLKDQLIYLKSNETLYFETFIDFPINLNYTKFVKLKKQKNYSATLIIHSDTTNIKKYLTWSQLKNIEANNYKLYHGTIVSENSVPIVFVDK